MNRTYRYNRRQALARSARYAAGCGLLAALPAAEGVAAVPQASQVVSPPVSVSVRPVFFIPTDRPHPSPEQAAEITRQLLRAQARYEELLGTTFTIASNTPDTYLARKPHDYYAHMVESGARQLVGELLSHYNYNRFNCPYIYLIIYGGPNNYFEDAGRKPGGGGRSFNGGYNSGGGIIQIPLPAIQNPNQMQKTLQHELGHSFGLPHIDAYGYDLSSNPSIMSYNRLPAKDIFVPNSPSSTIEPEDRFGLALNKRAFPKLTFDPQRDIPAGYTLKPVRYIPPMKIDGQVDYDIHVTTNSGVDYNSAVENIVLRQIQPIGMRERNTYDAQNMWQSRPVYDLADATLTFPIDVRLDRIVVYSGHSGGIHQITGVRLEALGESGQFEPVTGVDVTGPDETLTFSPRKVRTLRFLFRPGETRAVLIRGIRFFCGNEELFGPMIPMT